MDYTEGQSILLDTVVSVQVLTYLTDKWINQSEKHMVCPTWLYKNMKHNNKTDTEEKWYHLLPNQQVKA